MIDSRGNEVLYNKMGKRIRKTLKNGNPSKAYQDAQNYGIEATKPDWAKKATKKGKKAAKPKPFSLTRKYSWADPATRKAVEALKQIEQEYEDLPSNVDNEGVPATKYALRVKAKDFVDLYRFYKINPNGEPDIQKYLPNGGKYKYAYCPRDISNCESNPSLQYGLPTGEKCCRPDNYYSTISIMAKRKRGGGKKKKAASKKRKPCKTGKRRSRVTGRCRKV